MLLKFFDPQEEPYGVFSNMAQVPVEVSGKTYPSVQHAIYMVALGSFPDREELLSIKTAFDLRANFETMRSKKYLSDLADAVEVSYSARLQQQSVQIASNKKYIFYFTQSTLSDRPSKYLLGVDDYRYGFNLVGKTLQKMYHGMPESVDVSFRIVIYMASLAANELVRLVMSGDNLSSYGGLLPSEILERIGMPIDKILQNKSGIDTAFQQYSKGTLPHYSFVKMEIDYPRSLCYMIRKKYAPYMNYYVDESIKTKLLESTAKVFAFTEYHVPPTMTSAIVRSQLQRLSVDDMDMMKGRIMALYTSKRLSMEESVAEEIHKLASQRLSPEQISQSVNFIPLNILPEFIDIEKDQPILDVSTSPLNPLLEVQFQLEGMTFYSVLHAIYFTLFTTLLPPEEAYRLLLVDPKKKPTGLSDFLSAHNTNFDDMYNRVYVNQMMTTARLAIADKFQRHPRLLRLLWKTEMDGITSFRYDDPNDAIFGYVPQLETVEGNMMNQTGKMILQVRSDLQPALTQEHAFFFSVVGDNLFLEVWLKGKLMDWRRSLFWFKKMVKTLDQKALRLFFTKFYTPFHTLYRHQKPTPVEPDSYFSDFFKELALPTECIHYIYAHFMSMYTSMIESSDDSTEILQETIQHSHPPALLPNADNILRKSLALLQYIPHRYDRKTLGCYLSLVTGSDTMITVPEKTYFMSADSPVYVYSIPGLPLLLNNLSLKPQVRADLSFVVSHLVQNTPSGRYHFFFS